MGPRFEKEPVPIADEPVMVDNFQERQTPTNSWLEAIAKGESPVIPGD